MFILKILFGFNEIIYFYVQIKYPLDSLSGQAYEQFDESKKDWKWCDLQLTTFRRMQRPLVTQQRSITDRSLLYSVQPLQKVKDSFDDEDFKKNTDFLPLPILEPMVNSIVEDLIKSPPRAELRAIDPTAIGEKKQDVELLANRKQLADDRTELQQSVGLPEYQVGYDQFKGNVEEFDRMGLDEQNQDDVVFYEDNIQKLNHEIAGQAVLDVVFKNSRFNKTKARNLAKDIFATKVIVTQKYVDKITGEIKDDYIDPQFMYGVWGQTNDGTDDVYRSYMKPVTVMEFIQKIGNDFDFSKHWRYLIWAINYCNTRKFTGFIRGGVPYDCCGTPFAEQMGVSDPTASELLDWTLAYTFKIFLGYGEWRSPEATSTFLINENDKNFSQEVPFNYALKKKQKKEGYQKESFYQVPWYNAWFIATTSVSQWIFNYGKIYFQRIEGANDEYSNGTLCYYQEEGLSAVEIARPYLELANFAFYRMKWIIYKAQPDKDEYVYEELVQLAGNVMRQFPQAQSAAGVPSFDNVIKNIIEQMRKKHVRIRTYPKIDGRSVQQIYPIEKKGSGGVDPIAMGMQAIIEWAEMNIMMKIGINPMRLGQNPPSRESTASEQRAIDYSLSTTGYFYRMIQYLKEHLGVCALNFAQDIVKYKESLPYKWLVKMIGTENMENLKSLDNFAFHRYAMFIEDYNTNIDKQDIKAAANMALGESAIDLTQWGLVTQTEDPKKALKLLAYYQQKKAKEEMQAKTNEINAAAAKDKQLHDMKMEEINLQGQWSVKEAFQISKGNIAVAQIQNAGKVDVKAIQSVEDYKKIKDKTESTKEIETHKATLKQAETAAV